MTRPTVAVAVSGHGFGHAVRAAEVARALLERGARVLLRTDAPGWLFPPEAKLLASPGWPLDVGVVQRDGLDMDIDATRIAWRGFSRDFERRAEVEAHLLRDVDVVVGDIPPLAFAAAAKAEVPSFAMTNFTWDWIYAAWPDFEDIVARIRSSYADAQALLRLPLHSDDPEAFSAFSRIRDVPLIARHATSDRDAVRRAYGLPSKAPVVLLSFGGFTANGLQLGRLGRWRQYVFVLTPPIATEAHDMADNVRMLNPPAAEYVSLLAACDVVVTKPGYGIVADCLANRVAVLFTDRGPFREYDVLADALLHLGRARYIAREDVLAGELGPDLDALLELRMPWIEQATNGAEVVADLLLQSVTMDFEKMS